MRRPKIDLHGQRIAYSDIRRIDDMMHGCGRQETVQCRCGPANHSLELAQRGLKVFALDLHPGLLAYAKSKASSEGVDKITFLNEDMQEFTLPVS